MKRKNFSEVFEGKNPRGTPEVQLRRLTTEETDNNSAAGFMGNTIGIFWGPDLIALVDFDDLFDENGNRFYND